MTVHVGQTYSLQRNTVAQPDRVTLWSRPELVDIDSAAPFDVVLDNVRYNDPSVAGYTPQQMTPPQPNYYPSMIYSGGGVDPEDYRDFPVLLLPEAPITHPYKWARIWQTIGPTTIGGLDIHITGLETLATDIPVYLIRFLRLPGSYDPGTGYQRPTIEGFDAVQGIGTFDFTGINAVDDIDDLPAEPRSYVESQLERDNGIQIITSPGQLDTDNYRQPELPTGWQPIPGYEPPIYEKATFICFSRYVEPKIVGGQAEQVRDGSETITVSLPDLPTKTILTGITQGLEFEASNVETTILMDGVVWQVDSASELDRLRYEVVLSKTERA